MKLMPLVVIGAGGFGQEVVWAAENNNKHSPSFEILGYCDDNPDLKDALIYGFPVLGTPEDVRSRLGTQVGFVCAIGNNRTREIVVNRVLAFNWMPLTVIDPSVIVARGVSIGEGSYVGAGTILSPNASIGRHVIINHHCSIGHDSTISDFAQAAPGVRVSGACQIGRGSMLGSNSVVAPGRTVGDYATVSAASFAVADVSSGTTAVGVPARVMMRQR